MQVRMKVGDRVRSIAQWEEKFDGTIIKMEQDGYSYLVVKTDKAGVMAYRQSELEVITTTCPRCDQDRDHLADYICEKCRYG